MAAGPHGAQASAWVSQGRGSLPPPSPTAHMHPAPSSLPPPPPPSRGCLAPSLTTRHPAPRTPLLAPSTPHHEPVAAAEAGKCRGQGKGHPEGSPWGHRHCHSQKLPRPPRPPKGATHSPPCPRGGERGKAAAAPWLCLGLDAILGVIPFLFSASNLWGCVFFINSCLENNRT